MCPISVNIYRMILNEGHFSSGTAIIHFWDKPYQKMNFKSHLNNVLFVNKEKYCQICTCPVWLYFTLPVCAHFSKETDKCQS